MTSTLLHQVALDVQAADEEERVHLQTLLSQSQASEAEAIRRAAEATQRLSSAFAQHQRQSHLERELQEVCRRACCRCREYHVLMDKSYEWYLYRGALCFCSCNRLQWQCVPQLLALLTSLCGICAGQDSTEPVARTTEAAVKRAEFVDKYT